SKDTLSGTSGSPASLTLTATGGTPPYTWKVEPLLLPIGFSLTADGVLSGTSPAYYGGDYRMFPVQITDSASPAHSATVTIGVDMFGFSPDTFTPVPQVGVDYEQGYVHSQGGIEPLQWVLDGTVPPGMTFKKNPASTDTREYGLYGAPTQTGH